MKEVTIVCDGSSLGNGKGNPRAAAAAALGYKGYWRAFGEYLGNATNQQAEIAAAAIGLEKLSEPCKVRVLTDSRYVVQTMQGNFRKKTNLEWWARIDKAAAKHQIKWAVVGGGIILHLSTKRAREVELHLGVATRLEDAIIPMIALGYDGWKGGFSYDVNTSDFKNATDKKGGPEFFLTYTWKKLYPLEQTRVCSIF